MHSVSTFLCVYVWSDLSCDLSVIEGSGAAHMGSRRTVLIISPRDISGSSVPVAPGGPGGKCLLGRGQVTCWPGLLDWDHYLEAIRATARRWYTRCDAGITTEVERGLFVAMILPCDWDKTRIEGRGHRVAGSPVALWGTCCPNILIFWILDYGIFN